MNSNALHEILNALQRLEARLDGQDSRIGEIEISVCSETTSPTTSRGHSVRSDGFHGPQSQFHDDYELQSPFTSICPSQHMSPASNYKAPIEELRRRFEFVESNSRLNLNIDVPGVVELETNKIAATPGQNSRIVGSPGTSAYEGGIPKNKTEGAYSESAYSRPLSRLDFSNLPEMPSLPVNHIRAQQIYLDEKKGSASIKPENKDNSLDSCSVIPACCYNQEEGSHIPISSSGHSHRAHEPLFLMFLPCDHCKESLQYSRLFRFRESRGAQKKQKLLAELSKSVEVPGMTSSWKASTRGTSCFRSLRNTFSRIFGRKIYVLK